MKFHFKTPADTTIIALCALTILAMFVPTLVQGVTAGDDLRYHMSWFLSYRDALGSGVFYPRWLPDQMAGLGSPALYFYPPFATFFFGLVDTLSLHRLAPTHVLGTAAFLMAALSAVAFHLWARIFVSARVAAIVAACYALAPYHLMVDLHARAAFAEYAAYIWVPLIFAGVGRVVAGRGPLWLLCLVTGVAGLFFTHLLTAMMVGPVAALYTLYQVVARRRTGNIRPARRLAILALAVCCALGLAAVFLLPAIRLLEFTDVTALYRRPVSDSVMGPSLFATTGVSWQAYQFNRKLAFCVGIYLCTWCYLLVELALASGDRQRRSVHWPQSLLWAGVIGTCLLFIFGHAGFLFVEPSPLRSIQFVWRFLVVVEFAMLSLFLTMHAPGTPRPYRKRISIVCALAFAAGLGVQIIDLVQTVRARAAAPSVMTLATVKSRLSPTEYFPAQTGFPMAEKQVMPRLQKLGAAPVARVIVGSATVLRTDGKDGRFVVEIDAAGPATIALRQFYFPGWHAVDQDNRALPVAPATPEKLATFHIERGRHQVTVTRSLTDEEKQGRTISLASLLLLIVVLYWARR